MATVFVSHSHRDNEYCRAFVRALQRQLQVHGQGLDIWYDEQNLGAGVISAAIEKQLRSCRYYIVILSPAALASDWVNAEMQAVLSLRRRGREITFLPVIAMPCEVPPLLERFMRIEGAETADVAAQLAYEFLLLKPQTNVRATPEVKVITDESDPDLDQFVALYTVLFPKPEERASQEDMMRYITEAQEEKAKTHPQYLEELLIVKLEGEVVAFMNYTFYYASRYAFVSYIGSKQLGSATKAVMSALLTRFAATMRSKDVACRGLVFEVENKNYHREARRRRSDVEISRLRRFRTYLTRFAQEAEGKLYEIDFNFIQPYLLIEEVQAMPGKARSLFDLLPRTSQLLGYDKILRLGYIPLTVGATRVETTITKNVLLELLRFVYLEVYADSFIDSPASDTLYKQYMRRLIRYYARILPQHIRLSQM